MTRSVAVTLALAALTLAGCGDSTGDDVRHEVPGGSIQTEGTGEDATTVVRTDDGSEAVIATGSEAAASTGPVFSRPYPGSRVVSSVTSATENAGLVTFETDAQADTIIAYYRERVEEAELTPRADMTMNGTRHFGAESNAGGEFNVVITPQDDRSVVTVSWQGIPG